MEKYLLWGFGLFLAKSFMDMQAQKNAADRQERSEQREFDLIGGFLDFGKEAVGGLRQAADVFSDVFGDDGTGEEGEV